MAYRDELEALRARLSAVEAERDAAVDEVRRLRTGSGTRAAPRPRALRTAEAIWRSIPGGEPTPLTVLNESARKIEVFWLSYDGRERSAGTLVPGGRMRTQTYVGHCWRIVDAATGEILSHTHVKTAVGEPILVHREP